MWLVGQVIGVRLDVRRDHLHAARAKLGVDLAVALLEGLDEGRLGATHGLAPRGQLDVQLMGREVAALDLGQQLQAPPLHGLQRVQPPRLQLLRGVAVQEADLFKEGSILVSERIHLGLLVVR